MSGLSEATKHLLIHIAPGGIADDAEEWWCR